MAASDTAAHDLKDKIRGLVVGGAVGDAVGLYTEFMSADQARRVYGQNPLFGFDSDCIERHKDHHRLGFAQGAWTDDTDQALLFLLGFNYNKGALGVHDFALRLRSWVENGLLEIGTPCADVGITVGAVVADSGFLEDPVGVAKRIWVASGHRGAANGAVMRTSFLAPLLLPPPGETPPETEVERWTEVAAKATEMAKVTHGDPRCIVSSVIVTVLCYDALLGGFKAANGRKANWARMDEIVAFSVAQTELLRHQDGPTLNVELLKAYTEAMTLRELKLDEGSSIGYTYKTLGATIVLLRKFLAQWSEEDTSDTLGKRFAFLLTELTLCGGDADTNAQPACSLIGAIIGYDAIPERFKDHLFKREWLLGEVEKACDLLGL